MSENGFAILANRWRVLDDGPVSLELEKVKVIVLAAITLHNWLFNGSTYRKVYIPSELDSQWKYNNWWDNRGSLEKDQILIFNVCN